MAYSFRGRNVMTMKSVQGALSPPDTHTLTYENTHRHIQYTKNVTHKLSNIDHGWTKGKKENLMHLAFNTSRYVLGFLFDLSHWRLVTNVLYSHEFELRQMVFADKSWILV